MLEDVAVMFHLSSMAELGGRVVQTTLPLDIFLKNIDCIYITTIDSNHKKRNSQVVVSVLPYAQCPEFEPVVHRFSVFQVLTHRLTQRLT